MHFQIAPIDDDDRDRKKRLDEITEYIKAHKSAAFAVGCKLVIVRDEKLYRPRFKTLEEYARKEFSFPRRTAYNWIDWAQMNLECEPELCAKMGANDDPPINKAHVRQLMRLPSAKRKETWDTIKAKAKADGKKVTGAYAAPIVQKAMHGELVANARQAVERGAKVKSTKAVLAEIHSRIFVADNRQDVPEIPDDGIDLVVCSPHYNINTRYDVFRDDQPRAEYLDDLAKSFAAIHRKLKRGGRLCVNVPAVTNNAGRRNKGYLFNLGDAIKTIVLGLEGMINYQEVVWDKGVISNAQESAWGSYLSCSQPNCRRMTERVYVFARGTTKRKADKSRQDLGVDEEAWRQAAIDLWRIPTDSTLVTRYGHPAAFSVEIPRRCMQFFGQVGDVCWDPWGGIGSTAVAAALCGRTCYSTDLSADYTAIARDRVAEALKGGPNHD